MNALETPLAGMEVRAEIRDFRRATVSGFNALRADFVDLRQEMNRRFEQVDRNFEQVDRNFEQVDRNFEQVDRGFIEMRGKFDATAAGQQRINELIESLIDQQDR